MAGPSRTPSSKSKRQAPLATRSPPGTCRRRYRPILSFYPPPPPQQPPSPKARDAKRVLKTMESIAVFRPTEQPQWLMFDYPEQEGKGPLPLTFKAWEEYDKKHVFMENLHCFCHLCSPGAYKHVLVLIQPASGEHADCIALACPNWQPGLTAGCGYFVNLNHLFESKLKNRTCRTKVYPLSPVFDIDRREPLVDPPLTEPEQAELQKILEGKYLPDTKDTTTAAGTQSSSPSCSFPSQPARPYEEPRWLKYVIPGRVASATRLVDDNSGLLMFHQRDLASERTVKSELDMLNYTGVDVGVLMQNLAQCRKCRRVYALHIFGTHSCIPHYYRGLLATGSTGDLNFGDWTTTPPPEGPTEPFMLSPPVLSTPTLSPLKTKSEPSSFFVPGTPSPLRYTSSEGFASASRLSPIAGPSNSHESKSKSKRRRPLIKQEETNDSSLLDIPSFPVLPGVYKGKSVEITDLTGSDTDGDAE